jgi:hypothetical protein
MPTYTVTAAEEKKRVDGKYGPMVVFNLRLKGPDGIEHTAEWFTKATTPLPAPGTSLEGDLEDGQYGKSFKKAKPANGFSGGGGAKDAYWEAKEQRDIEGIVRMGRAHSQEMALRAISTLKLTEYDSRDGYRRIIKEWTDWFVADLDNASPNAGGGSSATPQASGPPTPVTNGSAAPAGPSDKQLDFLERLLQEAGVDVQDRLDIKAWAEEKLTGGKEGTMSAAIDAVKSGTADRLITAAKAWVATQSDIPADTRDLQPAPDTFIADDESIPF